MAVQSLLGLRKKMKNSSCDHSYFHHRLPSLRNTVLILLLLFSISACTFYGERVAPVPLPSSQANHVDVMGAKLAAFPYVDEDSAEDVFGFDIRDTGLLPVRFVIDNQSEGTLEVDPSQTFLIDEQGQAWPLLTSKQAYKRVSSSVEVGETFKGAIKPTVLLGAAGAVAGFAIGVLTGNIGEGIAKGAVIGASIGAIYGGGRRNESLDSEIRYDLQRHSLRNEKVRKGELAYGYLFFPGKDEAESAQALRLGLLINGEHRVVNILFLNQ
jgi:hypothetical protein